MSDSTLSLVPAAAAPRVVRSRVSGISDTSAQPDRPPLDCVAQQLGPEPHPQPPSEPVVLSRDDLAHAVDMALEDVAPEAVRRFDRQLEVDPPSRLEPAERGDLQRLIHRLGGE